MVEASGVRQALKRGGLGVISLLIAGFTGCAAASSALAVMGLFMGFGGFGLGFLIGLMTLPFWIGGLFLIGGPLWAVLHQAGRRNRLTSILAGGAVAAIAAPVILWGVATDLRFLIEPDAVIPVLLASLPGAVGGAVAGFTVWRVGYDEERVR